MSKSIMDSPWMRLMEKCYKYRGNYPVDPTDDENPALEKAEAELKAEGMGEYIRWKEEKALFFQSIRGTTLPLGFKIVFRIPDAMALQISDRLAAISSMFLNVNYTRLQTTVTTGISMKSFPSDPSIGQEFDAFVKNVFQKMEIG